MEKNLPQKVFSSRIFMHPEKLTWIIFLDNLALNHKDDPTNNFVSKPHLMCETNNRHSICSKLVECILTLESISRLRADIS